MNWIWLSASSHPDRLRSRGTCFERNPPPGQAGITVCEFAAEADFPAPPARVRVVASADAAFALSLNGRLLWTGPAPVGGDWLPLSRIPAYYADEASLDLTDGETHFAFSALVRADPLRGTELSTTRDGFALDAEFSFPDGAVRRLGTDSAPVWRVRLRPDFLHGSSYDGRIPAAEWERPEPVRDVWHARIAPVPVCVLRRVEPAANAEILLPPGAESGPVDIPFDRIHAAYVLAEADAPCSLSIDLYEKDASNRHAHEEVVLDPAAGHGVFRSLALHSVGGYLCRLRNLSPDRPAAVRLAALASEYPVTKEGHFRSSDPGLDAVYEVCARTLRVCRQSMHLDSPRHQEPLACTGDYAIEALMTAFTFGDMRLAALDVRRTAGTLLVNDGRLFHTAYSLLWVGMLRDVHDFTGDDTLLRDCRPALDLLLARFRTYIGANGLVDSPPDYMFVDWLVFDGYSMHHPPKYLGQTALNAFYHGALLAAAEIFRRLGDPGRAAALLDDAAALRAACDARLYDARKGLFRDGLGDADPGEGRYRPANPVGRVHYSRHANVLAVLYGLREGSGAAELLRRVLRSDLPDVQPYFMHYVLEAVDRCGLFEEFGLSLLRRWIPLAEECPKGLKEGWHAPEPDYAFDYSHAWGGTPAYQLPAKLLGFRMLEPGFRRFELRPRLCGLEEFDIEIPTPDGFLRCRMEEGREPVIEFRSGRS